MYGGRNILNEGARNKKKVKKKKENKNRGVDVSGEGRDDCIFVCGSFYFALLLSFGLFFTFCCIDNHCTPTGTKICTRSLCAMESIDADRLFPLGQMGPDNLQTFILPFFSLTVVLLKTTFLNIKTGKKVKQIVANASEDVSTNTPWLSNKDKNRAKREPDPAQKKGVGGDKRML